MRFLHVRLRQLALVPGADAGHHTRGRVFGSAFFDARFVAVWAKWHGIKSDGGKQLGEEGILLARSRTGGVDG